MYGISPAVVGSDFYLAVATGVGVDLMKNFATIYSHNITGPVTAVSLVADDLYYAGGSQLRAKYNIGGISGNWTTSDASYSTATTPDLISNDVNSLAGRAGASTAIPGDNRIYVGTDGGLTVLEEDQGQEASGSSLHYGYTGSTSAALDYKVLAGETDRVTRG